ncbi:uncharacterized protein LOC125379271 [Haliotis rufescens]|uniref:uncharacterized protein LOC125379271 n=1 Tax=Haliotis rufescens TaxID=6454 RepID=UPI00201F62DA|nr:uncharacterized protein LOC125379271 [Haliotis rufescens]
MKGGKTQSLHHHSFIWQLEIDERNRLLYFADLQGMFVIDYDGKGLKKIHNRQPGDIFYNEAEKRLYWLDQDTIISQKQDPLGDQHAIQKIDKETFSLTIHNQILYLNEYAERGFTLMTLEGERLPSLATDVLPTDDDAYLAFL